MLRAHTTARIGLGRAGGSIPTSELLSFRLAHAAARDAVQTPFDAEGLASSLVPLGLSSIILKTEAADKRSYLQYPDQGRCLDNASRDLLRGLRRPESGYDLSITVSDGLSALAAERQAMPLLTILIPLLVAEQWTIAPLVVARFGRVALQDDVGSVLQARIGLILIGERPGLGSPDSLGAYLVHTPRAGNTDANRNCVSNVRPEGLSFEAAAETLLYLLTHSRSRKISGVHLKDERIVNTVRGLPPPALSTPSL